MTLAPGAVAAFEGRGLPRSDQARQAPGRQPDRLRSRAPPLLRSPTGRASHMDIQRPDGNRYRRWFGAGRGDCPRPWLPKVRASLSSILAWSGLSWSPNRSAASPASCDMSKADSAEAAFAKCRPRARAGPHTGQRRRHPHRREAGRQGRAAPLREFRKVVEVNLIGTFNMMRLVCRPRSQGWSR